jgi:phosphoribosylamine-glycine ligase
MYHSCGLDSEGNLNVGHERGLAFIAEALTIPEANEKVEAVIATIDGDFYHRGDIGTKALLDGKVARATELRR